jgi:hypothetical protein
MTSKGDPRDKAGTVASKSVGALPSCLRKRSVAEWGTHRQDTRHLPKTTIYFFVREKHSSRSISHPNRLPSGSGGAQAVEEHPSMCLSRGCSMAIILKETC